MAAILPCDFFTENQCKGPSPIIDIFFQTNDVRLGGGGGSEPVRLEEKSVLNFFWTGPEPRSGRRPPQCDPGPRRRHLAAPSRGRDPPLAPVWYWVFDVDTLTAFVDLRQLVYCECEAVKGHMHTLCKVSVVLHSFLPGERWVVVSVIDEEVDSSNPHGGGLQGQADLWRIVRGVWKSDPILWVCRRPLSSQPASSRRRYQRGAGRVEEGALESRWREAAHRRGKRDGAEGEVRVWMEGYHLCQSPAIFVIRQIGVWPTRIVLIVPIGILDIWRECHRVGPFVCRVLFPRGSSFCEDHIM